MQLHVDDAGFVRAPAMLVYRRLTDVRRWPQWWPGCRIQDRSVPSEERFQVELRGAWARRHRLEVVPGGWRHEHGFTLSLQGEVRGTWEFWLQHRPVGTVVHHLLVAETDQPAAHQLLADHRRAVRRGLWALKDTVQLEVRSGIGLEP